MASSEQTGGTESNEGPSALSETVEDKQVEQTGSTESNEGLSVLSDGGGTLMADG